MSKVSLLKYHSTDLYSHNISTVLVVSKNKEQLNQLAKRLSRFSSEDVFEVVTPVNPYIIDGKMATVLDDQSDVSYTHILKEYENVKDLKLENDEYCWMDIKDSLTSSDIQSAFLYVFSDPDCWKEKEAFHKKISLAKKNGEYYQNPEKFRKIEYLI